MMDHTRVPMTCAEFESCAQEYLENDLDGRTFY